MRARGRWSRNRISGLQPDTFLGHLEPSFDLDFSERPSGLTWSDATPVLALTPRTGQSIVDNSEAVTRKDRNPATSVTVVRMMEDARAGS